MRLLILAIAAAASSSCSHSGYVFAPRLGVTAAVDELRRDAVAPSTTLKAGVGIETPSGATVVVDYVFPSDEINVRGTVKACLSYRF